MMRQFVTMLANDRIFVMSDNIGESFVCSQDSEISRPYDIK